MSMASYSIANCKRLPEGVENDHMMSQARKATSKFHEFLVEIMTRKKPAR